MKSFVSVLLVSILVATLIFTLTGCEEKTKQPRVPIYKQVKIVHVENELAQLTDRSYVRRNAYTIVEDDENKRYSVNGKAGQMGDVFKIDISRLQELGVTN